ncbi:MAG: hypothetical protein JRJ69_16965, partial [Deltaproteobacteria bacterium]|nr:hypothetical protein [Deltaproteobacteria bacterium]
FEPIETGIYNLRIMNIERRPYFYKEDDPKVMAGEAMAGDVKGDRIPYRVVIIDHPTLSGRSIRGTLWPRPATFKALRRIADATGIEQDGDFDDWLKKLDTTKPCVTCQVRTTGEGENVEVSVNWFEVQPYTEASALEEPTE